MTDNERINIGEFLSPLTAEELGIFLRTSNKSGALHPNDGPKWMSFVIAAHRENSSLDDMTLGRYIAQHGWPEDVAWELANRFVTERALLLAYDGFQARVTATRAPDDED